MSKEELIKRFDAFAESYPNYETEICEAILDFERVAFSAAEKGKKVVEASETRVAEVDALIEACMAIAPMPEEIEERFMQALVSWKPRLETALVELKRIAENPPTESRYPQFQEDGEEEDKAEEDKSEVPKIVVEKWEIDVEGAAPDAGEGAKETKDEGKQGEPEQEANDEDRKQESHNEQEAGPEEEAMPQPGKDETV